jgi:type IV pilus assembly protein PilM
MQFAGKPVATALPESLAYTSIISMPYLSDAELASSIHWEAEQHIPVPLEEVQLEYQVLSKPKKGAVGEKMQVLLVASKKTVVERVNDLFDAAGLELVNLETGLLAGYRSIAGMVPQTGGVAFLNMGALSTDILIVESGKMMLTYAISTGGLVLTRAIQQGLGLTGQQAEEYKRAYGLDQTQLEGKVVASLTPVMNILIGEIRKAVQYYQSSQMGSGITTVLLTGGASYLRGLPAYLTQMLSAEVMVVNPFQTAVMEKDVTLPKDVAAYAVATGLVGSTAA